MASVEYLDWSDRSYEQFASGSEKMTTVKDAEMTVWSDAEGFIINLRRKTATRRDLTIIVPSNDGLRELYEALKAHIEG